MTSILVGAAVRDIANDGIEVATVTECLAQWDCGGELPACLDEPNPTPQCASDGDCAEVDYCADGVCQPDDSDVSCELICSDLEDRCENTSAKCREICMSLQPSLECTLCMTEDSCDAINGGSCDEICS